MEINTDNIKFSGIFMEIVRECAKNLGDDKNEETLKAPFNKFTLSFTKEKEGSKVVYMFDKKETNSDHVLYLFRS